MVQLSSTIYSITVTQYYNLYHYILNQYQYYWNIFIIVPQTDYHYLSLSPYFSLTFDRNIFFYLYIHIE